MDVHPFERPELSVILPTYNESESIHRLVSDILTIVTEAQVEIIVVDDDSPDGTGQLVKELTNSDSRIHLITQQGKLGLSQAVFTGAAQSSGRFICVMDADFSHDPEEIPEMLAAIREGYDVVIGSRYTKGSRFIGQPLWRRFVSSLLNRFARFLLGLRPRDVLTGYVILRREVIEAVETRYSRKGFKWLLEVLATQKSLRTLEWPIVFRDRTSGTSKASLWEGVAFLLLVTKLFAWKASHSLKQH